MRGGGANGSGALCLEPPIGQNWTQPLRLDFHENISCRLRTSATSGPPRLHAPTAPSWRPYPGDCDVWPAGEA
uniref:Uncharacterized protein n=1 Tax=Knipowitschia caucasica TaxID=637954 RepID=A0AAV2LI44_KNICA